MRRWEDFDLSIIPFFFGHHKSGTRYIGRIMERFCEYIDVQYAPINNPKWFGFDLGAALPQGCACFVNYMNADYRYVEPLDGFRGFHLVRDPRDLALSAYFSHLHSHSADWWPELVEHRKKLRALDFTQGVLADLEFTDSLTTDGFPIAVFPSMDQWNYDDPRIMEIKFEDLIAAPQAILTSAFDHLGLLDADRQSRLAILADCIADNAFERLSGGRLRGQTDDRHHYRAGTPGEWRGRLEEPHLRWFEDRHPDLLVRLGYEVTNDWRP